MITMSDLEFRDVSIAYGGTAVVDCLNLTIPSGKIVGLVGESGCGKSSLARAAVGLQPLSTGSILLNGKDIGTRRHRSTLQMVFQDPYGSLNPRMTIGRSIAEAIPRGLAGGRAERRAEVERLLGLVDIDPSRHTQLPSQLSGGQRQRVGIARALAGRPDVIIADEITSALDASVQGSVLNLVRNLQATLGVGMLFISHNMAVVRFVADTVAVMRQGRIVESGPRDQVFTTPAHPYTQKLLAASRLELDTGPQQGADALSRS